VVRVPSYRSKGTGFDSRRYQIFSEVVGLKRGPFSLVRVTEKLLEWKSSGSGSRKPKLTAVGIRCHGVCLFISLARKQITDSSSCALVMKRVMGVSFQSGNTFPDVDVCQRTKSMSTSQSCCHKQITGSFYSTRLTLIQS
jgi:hypothetical protein